MNRMFKSMVLGILTALALFAVVMVLATTNKWFGFGAQRGGSVHEPPATPGAPSPTPQSPAPQSP